MSQSENIDLKAVPLHKLSPHGSTMNIDGKEYNFRPVSIEDWHWMGETFGQKPEDMVNRGIPLKDMVRIIYRLLINKEDFVASTETTYDDEGEKVEKRVTGPEKLMKALIGFDGITELSRVFMECIGADKLSDEDREKLINAAKKKLKKAQ